MQKVWMVGLGGFLGSVSRYLLGSWLGRVKAGWAFPVETLAINVAGCLAIGVLAGMAEFRGMFSGTTRAFLFVGLLGGFTTFSAYGYETFQLLRDAHWERAAWSTALQVVLGIGGAWAGHSIVRLTVAR